MTDHSGGIDGASEEELKRLLFSRELALLAELKSRADNLDARVGDASALSRSLEDVLAETLRKADARDHDRMAAALSPLIVSSLRREMQAPGGGLADALDPLAGRLFWRSFRDAGRRALRALDDGIDWALAPRRWQARIVSLVTPESQAECLARLRPAFRPNSFVIVDRAGESVLAERGADDDLADILNTTLTFAQNTLREAEGGDLRRLDFGGDALFLRTSPRLLLAVRVSGPLPADVEARMSAMFDDFLRAAGGAEASADPALGPAYRGDLERRLDSLTHVVAETARGRPWRGGLLAAGLALALLGVTGFVAYGHWRDQAVVADMRAAVRSVDALKGFVVDVSVDGDSVLVQGLAPDAAAAGRLSALLTPIAAAHDRALAYELRALPTPAEQSAAAVAAALLPEVQARLAPLSQAVADAAFRLQDIEDDLASSIAVGADTASEVAGLRATIAAAEAEAEAARAALSEDLAARIADVAAAAASLETGLAATDRFAARQVERADAAAVGLAATDRQVAALTARVDAALSAIGADARDLRAATEALAAQASASATESAADRARLQAAEAALERLASLTVVAEAQQADIQQLRADLESARTELQAAQASALAVGLAGVSEQLQSTEARTAVQDGRLTILETRIAAEAGRLESALAAARAEREAALADLRAAVAAAPAAVEAELGPRIAAVETALDARAAALAAALAAQQAEVDAVRQAVEGAGANPATAALAERIAALEAGLAGVPAALGDLGDRAAALEAAKAALEAQLAAGAVSPVPVSAVAPASATEGPLAERVAALEAQAVEAIALLDQRIDHIAKEAQPRAATPAQAADRQLEGLSIRFAESTSPADQDAAGDVLRQVAEVALSLPEGVRVRVIGYADSDGTVEANRITSKRRSDWAVAALEQMGVPPERLLSVGRGAERLLSADAGDNSPNRRVEFEAF